MIDQHDPQAPIDPPEGIIVGEPGDHQIVDECPNWIVNKHVTDVVTEYFGEAHGDGRSIAGAWFDTSMENSEFRAEVFRRLAEIEEIREGYANMKVWVAEGGRL